MLFLSDLPSVVSGLSALFADYTLAYDRCDGSPSDKSSFCCRLQHDLTSIHQWFNEWATTFNPAKSAVVDFRGKRKKQGDCSASPPFCTMSVPVCEKFKHLGIQLTSTLSWTPHIGSLLHLVTHKVFILRRLAYRCRDNNFVCSLYLALVWPVLEYAGPVWDSYKKADSLRLERVQLSIAKSILRSDCRSTANISVLESIGWSTLSWTRRRFKLLLLWKLLHGEGPRRFLPNCHLWWSVEEHKRLGGAPLRFHSAALSADFVFFCPQLLRYGTPSLSMSHPLLLAPL